MSQTPSAIDLEPMLPPGGFCAGVFLTHSLLFREVAFAPQMSRRQIGIVVALLGVVAALIAALADPLGIGGSSGFGWTQGLLLAVGILLVIAGGVMVVRSPSSGTGAPPAPRGGA
jgi:hypothetical protein